MRTLCVLISSDYGTSLRKRVIITKYSSSSNLFTIPDRIYTIKNLKLVKNK